jgi:protein-serine/threonine kinase
MRGSSISTYDTDRAAHEREKQQQQREREYREREREVREREREMERQREREREKERERQKEREREKAAAQVSTKKKVEQRISTMTEAQIMDKLRKSIHKRRRIDYKSTYSVCCAIIIIAIIFITLGSVVTRGDPNELYKRLKRVGQG